MRRSNKKRLIPLALALVLALVGAALAVPTINMTVQKIGVGDATDNDVIVSPVDTATLNWVLDDTNPDFVEAVNLTFDKDISAGSTIYVKFYKDGSLVSGGVTKYPVQNLISANTEIKIDLDNEIDLQDFDEVKIIVVGPKE